MGKSKVLLSFIILCLVTSNYSLRILIAIPMIAKSHSILGHAMAKHLIDAGHQVVFVTPYPQKESVPNLKEISLVTLDKSIRKPLEATDKFKLKNMINVANGVNPSMVLFLSKKVHEALFEVDEFVNMLSNPNEQFDLVIAEWFFYDGIAGLASLFECPLIWFTTTEIDWHVLQLIDEIPNPAYNVDILSNNRPPLSSWQRSFELWINIKMRIFAWSTLARSEKSFYNTVFSALAKKRGVVLHSYEDTIYNASMTLINSHPSFATAKTLPQNAKYIGGFHVDNELPPLPKHLQTLMDSAKDGVIYFSMGSNIKSSDMTEDMRDSLLEMFAEFNQTIVWKFETDFHKAPSNVHLIKWAPQQSILAHPNLKIFISHGGQLSTTEAIHHGIPVIGVPVMGDQHTNMKSVESKGFGVVVKIADDLADKLREAIDKILRDPTYINKAKEISMAYHDRPISPRKEMVHWVEHVVRTQGAAYLRSPALMVPWYQKVFLDLLVLVALVLFFISFIVKTILRIIYQKHSKAKKNK